LQWLANNRDEKGRSIDRAARARSDALGAALDVDAYE
jgi:hypothetical protein